MSTVTCPFCESKPGQSCITSSGEERDDHADRVRLEEAEGSEEDDDGDGEEDGDGEAERDTKPEDPP